MTVSIILPTYNERENIVPLIKAIHSLLRMDHEIIVVDDNSPDGTSEEVCAYIRQTGNGSVKLVTRTRDRGLTRSIRRGILAARGDIIAWMDCDFSMPPSLIPKLIRAVLSGADIAVGSRFISGGRAKKPHPDSKDSAAAIFMSSALNAAIRKIFGYNFYDYTSGFVASRREILKEIPLRGDYGEYFIDLIVRAYRLGARITEIPYISVPRRHGTSKTAGDVRSLVRYGVGYMGTVMRLLGTSDRAQEDDSHTYEGSITIQPMKDMDIPKVAILHKEALPDTPASQLGRTYLRQLYGRFLGDKKNFGAVAVAGNRIVGVVTVSVSLQDTQRDLTRNMGLQTALQTFRALITGRVKLPNLLNRFIFMREVTKQFPGKYTTIETLCVDSRVRRRGVGKNLVAWAESAARRRHIHTLHVDTFTTNTTARKFYESAGFVLQKTIADSVVFTKNI